MILFGFIAAVASGVALPGHMLLFGRIINSFVFYSTVTNCTEFANQTIMQPSLSMILASRLMSLENMNMSVNVNSMDMGMDMGMAGDMSCAERERALDCTDEYYNMCNMFVTANAGSILNLTRSDNSSESSLLCGDSEQGMEVLENVLEYVCCPARTLREDIAVFSYIYVGMATAVLLAIFLATMFWNVSAYRQTKRIRQAFYRSVLYQDVGWFDVTEVSELSTRLAE